MLFSSIVGSGRIFDGLCRSRIQTCYPQFQITWSDKRGVGKLMKIHLRRNVKLSAMDQVQMN